MNTYAKPILTIENSNVILIDSIIASNQGSNKQLIVVEQNSHFELFSTIFINNYCKMCIGSALFVSGSFAKVK